MNERICKFGHDNALLGILTDAASPTVRRELPTVILLNAGLLHHVGQNRLNVTLARRLAKLGCTSFRFDFSGIGDSRMRTGSAGVRERNTAEIQEAIDYLEKTRGAKSFALIGLCTGADNAHRAAVADSRVCGVVMLDGYSYPTANYLIRRFRNKLFRLSHWKDFLANRIARLIRRRRRSSTKETAGSAAYFWLLPKKSQIENELRNLIEREVRMLQVFSGSNIAYNYAEQYADSFRHIDFNGLLKVTYMAEADHTYSIRADRERLLSVIEKWFDEEFSTACARAG